MAREKQTRRMIAMALAAAVTMSSVPVVAFAEEGEGGGTPAVASESTTTTNPDGSVTQSTETQTPTESGGTQIKTESVTTSGDADAETGKAGDNGKIEIKTEVTVKDKDGNVVENYTVTEGEESSTVITPDDGDEPDQPPVTVPLVPGEKTEGSASETTTSGDLPGSENDPEYDYTETTETDRTVTAETSGEKTVVNEIEAELETVKPVYNPTLTDELYSDPGHFGITDNDLWNKIKAELAQMKKDGVISEEEYNACINSGDDTDYVSEHKDYLGKNDPNNFYEMMEDPIMLRAIQKVLGEDLNAEASDADYRFVGKGYWSSQYVSHIQIIYAKDKETGKPLVDENGNYIIESVTKGNGSTPITISGVPVTGVDPKYLEGLGDIGDATTLDAVPYAALTPEYIESLGGDLGGVYDQKTGTRAQHFLLMDKDGNYVFAHCIDLGTGAITGKWYKLSNLEDNDYYASEDAEDHVRSIVMNGYWGTSDVQKADGTYETGSMAKVKNDLMEAVRNGDLPDTVKISYRENGEIVTKEVEVTEELLEGFTPGEALDVMQAAIWSYANGARAVQDGQDGVIVGGAYYGDTANGQSANHGATANDPEGMARMKLFYEWLIGLETEEDSTTVINEKNFGEASLTIGDKISSSEDGNSDTYEASLSFKAEFEVGENDELYVNLTYKDLDGKEQVVRKQLGRAGEEGSDSVIVPDADNSYTLTNLALTENQDFTFDLRLEGVQQLKQNAYVFVSENGIGESQTFVGIAEGTNTVDISTSVTVKFDVNEDDVLRKVRKWRDDGRIKFEGGGGGGTGSEDPEVTIDDPDVPLTEGPELEDILDEDVPLAGAPDEEGMVLGAEDAADEDGMVLGAEDELIAATGDSNHMMGAFGGMFAALAGMFMLRKKKEN